MAGSSPQPTRPTPSRPRISCSVVGISRLHKALQTRAVPLALESVHAGFPSVAQDYFVSDFSFDEHIISHPETTFAVTVAGDSMEGAGIFDGDLLLVDRSLSGKDGDIVIAILEADLTLKRLLYDDNGFPYLHPENPLYPNIYPDNAEELFIWGVVMGSYHYLHRPEPQSGSHP